MTEEVHLQGDISAEIPKCGSSKWSSILPRSLEEQLLNSNWSNKLDGGIVLTKIRKRSIYLKNHTLHYMIIGLLDAQVIEDISGLKWLLFVQPIKIIFQSLSVSLSYLWWYLVCFAL